MQARGAVRERQPPRAQRLLRVVPVLRRRVRGLPVSPGVPRDREESRVQRQIRVPRAAVRIHR